MGQTRKRDQRGCFRAFRASTGINEALELRDGDKKRFGGKGVLKAVENVNKQIAPELVGMYAEDQSKIDQVMLELDGTKSKENLVPTPFSEFPWLLRMPLPKTRFVALFVSWRSGSTRLPVPMMNILNGGEHADNSVDIQEFMIMPIGLPNFREALRCGSEIFQALKKILLAKNYSTGVGDEGGFAPNLGSNQEACELILEAVEKPDTKLVRKSSWRLIPRPVPSLKMGNMNFVNPGRCQKFFGNAFFYQDLCGKYPICSIEDPMDENDWEGFASVTKSLGEKCRLLGLTFCHQHRICETRIKESSANAVLIKLNQIGTVSETVATIEMCRKAGWNYVISHRSGETEDTFMADFAVAMGGGQIKTGSACRSERIAKYNRLLEIEAELGGLAIYG